MPAATPRLYFQILFQNEVLRIISALNVGSLCTRHENHGNTKGPVIIYGRGGGRRENGGDPKKYVTPSSAWTNFTSPHP